MSTEPSESPPAPAAVPAASEATPTPERILRAFALFDANSDGMVSQAEMRMILSRPTASGGAFSDSEFEELMHDLDHDGDGFLNLAEFARAFSVLDLDRTAPPTDKPADKAADKPSTYQLSRWENKAKPDKLGGGFEAALNGSPPPVRLLDAHWLLQV